MVFQILVCLAVKNFPCLAECTWSLNGGTVNTISCLSYTRNHSVIDNVKALVPYHQTVNPIETKLSRQSLSKVSTSNCLRIIARPWIRWFLIRCELSVSRLSAMFSMWIIIVTIIVRDWYPALPGSFPKVAHWVPCRISKFNIWISTLNIRMSQCHLFTEGFNDQLYS